MNVDNRLVKVAINTFFIDKQPINGDEKYFAEEWKNAELTISDFAKCINEGWAYCPQLDGKRNSKNFHCSNIVSVDIDDGMTIEEAMQHPFAKHHLSLLYTTPSHTPTHHRFRLIFILPRDVIDPVEQTILNRALTRMFGGDDSTVDPSRIFFGSSQSEPIIFDGMLDQAALDTMLDIGKQAESDTLEKKSLSSRRSKSLLDPSMEVTTAEGKGIRVGDVQEHTRILCPFHHDKSSSAFITKSERGSTFLHCVVCKTTHWVRTDTKQQRDEQQPLDFVETCRAIGKKECAGTEVKNIHFQTSGGHEMAISFLNDKFFALPSIAEGLTFIKSPKGSGKTTSLFDAMRPALNEIRFFSFSAYEEADDDGLPVVPSDYSVLLIGHRQALIRDLCNRLQLNCYLDDGNDVKVFGKARKRRYGVCLDSLWKVRSYHYDLVIIDEVEQVLGHFLADTLKQRESVFKLMEAIVASSRSVVALDADLDWTAFRTLTGMQRRHQKHGFLSGNIHIFINEFVPPSRPIKIYQSKNELLTELMDDIQSGNRCFVSSNSKTLIKKIDDAISEKFRNEKISICITSDNSKNVEIQRFVNNIKQEAKKYDVILSSPSLGTGVDITFEDDEVGIDVVYGFYETPINTHTDIDQQLSRVRHPGDVKVWVSHRKFEFETNFDVMMNDLLSEHFVENAFTAIDPITRTEIYDTQNPFLRMAAAITSVQRQSKNHLRKNFIDYKMKNGWEINVIEKNDEQTTIGSSLFQAATQRLLQKRADELMTSKPLSMDQFLEMKDRIDENDSLSTAELLSFIRTSIEHFYSQPISTTLIELDRQNRFRRATRIYELLTSADRMEAEFPEHSKIPHPDNKLKFKIFKDFQGAVYLVAGLMATLPFYKSYTFDTSEEYTAKDLAKFIKNCKKFKPYIEGLLGEEVRADIDEKPAQQLGRILKLIGLKQIRTRTSKIDGVKIYHYQLDEASMMTMKDIAHHRNLHRADPWKFIHQIHQFDQSLDHRMDPDTVDGDQESLQLAFELRATHQPPFPRPPTEGRG